MTTTEVTTTVSTTDASVVDWLSAIGTLLAVLVALALGVGVVEWWRRPKLRLEISDEPFDRVTTMTVGGDPAAYLRARIVNHGGTAAKNVNVTVLSVSEWIANTRSWIRRKPELDGRALAWSNADPAGVVDIPAEVERPADVISITRNWAPGQQGHIRSRSKSGVLGSRRTMRICSARVPGDSGSRSPLRTSLLVNGRSS